MLLRFVIKNVFSFGDQKEFNTLPNKRLKTLRHHIYNLAEFDFLKLSSIYGANGAGKSNLIKGLDLLQSLILLDNEHVKYLDTTFKFNSENDSKDQLFAVEFIEQNKPFYFAMIVNRGRIVQEELYISGLGKGKDQLIYERKTDPERNTTMQFTEEFEQDEKNRLLKMVLIEELVKYNEPVMKMLANRDNKHLAIIKTAYNWFDKTLQIITPDAKVSILPHKLDIDKQFGAYVKQMMCSFNLGVSDIKTEKKGLEDFFGIENRAQLDDLRKEMKDKPDRVLSLRDKPGNEIVIVNENDNIVVKYVTIGHSGKGDQSVYFEMREESDGTRRMLDYIPALRSIVFSPRVIIVDEIERSIHPLLIKELVQKFSLDERTKGQLIFTTHESQLLDQSIFRQDEIWFAEKDSNGSTDIYSLNDFKEHKTIDIEKGYLSGRYGSIPFLGNLTDLNWHEYDTDEPVI